MIDKIILLCVIAIGLLTIAFSFLWYTWCINLQKKRVIAKYPEIYQIITDYMIKESEYIQCYHDYINAKKVVESIYNNIYEFEEQRAAQLKNARIFYRKLEKNKTTMYKNLKANKRKIDEMIIDRNLVRKFRYLWTVDNCPKNK